MGLFGNLTDDGLEQKEDRVGGGSYARETDIYEMEVKVAYAGKSAGGAQFVAFIFADSDGKEYRENFYVTNKNGQNFYMVKDKDGKETGKKKALAGFDHVNDICLMVTDKPLSAQNTEDKTVKVYDTDAQKELPKSVPVLTDLIGGKVYLAIYKKLENKSKKEGNEYVPTADTRDVNTTEKVFHVPTKMTVLEATQGAEAPAFFDSWLENHKGKVQDKRTIKDGEAGHSGRPAGRSAGAPPAAGASGDKPRKSLFGG